MYDIPGGQERGGHAHYELEQFIIATSGSFDIVLNDSKNESIFNLRRSYYGLYVPNLLWRRMENFSTNSLCMVLASDIYKPKDYIRNRRKRLH